MKKRLMSAIFGVSAFFKRIANNSVLAIILGLFFFGQFVYAAISNLASKPVDHLSVPKPSPVKKEASYDITRIYQITDLQSDSKVIINDELKEATSLLTPLKVPVGKYIIKVTRKAANLYKVDDKNIFIETKYCYEYSYSQQVVLIVESSYGYSIGKLIF